MNKLKYTFRNDNPTPKTFIIEPWPEEFVVPAGSVLTVLISYTHIELIETELTPDFFIIWLWKGCTAEVSLDGKALPPGALSMPWPV